MNKDDFAYIGCRLLALYWAVRAIYSLTSFAISYAAWKSSSSEFSNQMEDMIYFSLAPLVLYIIIAIILWFGAGRIVQLILPVNPQKRENSPISLFQVQAVAFASVGLFILFNALPEIGGVLYKVHLAREMDSYAHISFETKALIFEYALRICLGTFLLFGSKGLSGLLVRLRQAGMK